MALLAAPATAEPLPVDISANVRSRIESIANSARAGVQSDETLFNLRTTIAAIVGKGSIRVGAALVDSRAYSPGRRTAANTNEVDAVELVQAWVSADAGDALGQGSSLRFQGGRMLLDIGSRRLIANDDYRNTTNGFTGVRGDLSLRGWSLTGFYVLPQIRLPEDPDGIRSNRVALDREGFDLRLAGGLLTRQKVLGPVAAEIGVYRLDERDRHDRATRDRHLTTLSGRLFRTPAPGRLDAEIEYIRQTGSVSASLAATAPTLAVAAWFVHGSVGYSFPHRWHPRVAIEYDEASGDGRGAKFGRFDTLFGMRRADLAPAGLYFAVGRTNVATPAIRFEIAPTKRVDAFVAWRGLWLASRYDAFSSTGVRDPSGASGRHAGNQIDARIRWWAIPDRLRLEADAVYLAKGRFLRVAPNSSGPGDTRYGSLNATAFF